MLLLPLMVQREKEKVIVRSGAETANRFDRSRFVLDMTDLLCKNRLAAGHVFTMDIFGHAQRLCMTDKLGPRRTFTVSP